MKLTEIAIEGNAHSGRIHFRPFDRGLNFVYGENGAGKTFFGSFLRDLFQRGSTQSDSVQGNAVCTNNRGTYNLRLHSEFSKSVQIESLQSDTAAVSSVSQITGSVTPALYDTVYNFSLRETRRLRHSIAQLLHDNFSVSVGPEAADPSARVNHQPRISQVNEQLAKVRGSIEELTLSRNRILGDISSRQSDQSRLHELNLKIEQASTQLSQLNRDALHSRLNTIDQEIQNLQGSIDRAATRYVSHVPPQPTQDAFKHLYQRLDEVDQQLERWRQVQSDVQNQRVRLKDEMVVWNEMTLESDDHPYHNAREILVGLESRVDQAEHTAARWSGTTASQVDVTQMANAVENICRQMREDLYALCAELSSQYKYIRQRAAAEELKQLRRCYHEMGENTNRLVKRRQQVIDDIRAVDPAGADAIVRSEQAFCQCAAHEGYLTARRRFIGDVQNPSPEITRIEPDLSAEHNRLSQLNSDRSSVIADLNRIDNDYAELDRTLSSLIHQRDMISVSDVALLETQRAQLDNDLRTLEAEEQSLRRQLTELHSLPTVQPSQILIYAGQLLSQMSQGELTQVFLSDHVGHENDRQQQFDLQIRDSVGRVHNFTGVDQSAQDRVYLSLALSLASSLRNSSIELPIIVDDSFVHIGPDHVSATLETLNQCSLKQNQQIILLSQHRYLADRLPSMVVFELPPAVPLSTPYERPSRSTPVSIPNERHPMPASVSRYPIEAHTSDLSVQFASANNRPYPLSKYSADPAQVGPAAISEITNTDNDFRLPWSPLNQTIRDQTSSASVTSTSAHAFARVQPEPTPVAIDSMSLSSTGLFDLSTLGDFHDAGITTIEQLIELDIDQLSRKFSRTNLTNQQIEKAQTEALIYWSSPELSAEDAKLLVLIGIVDPEDLIEVDADSLVAQIQQFLRSSEGQRFQRTSSTSGRWNAFSRNRAAGWRRSVSNNRSRWGSRSRKNRSSASNRSRSWQSSNSRTRDSYRDSREPETYRVSNYPQRQRMDHGNLSREERDRSTRDARPNARPSSQDRTAAHSIAAQKPVSSNLKLKFYLDVNDDLEAAPSIGPKTAERFQKIGVITVADFLRQTAESMADRLNYKRLSADILRTWQNQTRLACRIPNLRGHDAQLLVACDVIDPDELAAMDPKALFNVIGPFSDTKEGLKIIRSGKKPDLAEVSDWISWAQHTRSLQAA